MKAMLLFVNYGGYRVSAENQVEGASTVSEIVFSSILDVVLILNCSCLLRQVVWLLHNRLHLIDQSLNLTRNLLFILICYSDRVPILKYETISC